MPSPSSSVPQLKILRAYAKLDDASIAANLLPPTVYFSHTRHTLTIFDAYPKALFHFLVLPRLSPTPATTATGSNADGGDGDERRRGRELEVIDSTEDLTSLRTLLQRAAGGDRDEEAQARARAEGTLSVLTDEATRLQGEIEREMLAHYGFTWPIWIGFHAVPSME
jgi:aprataxin